MTYPIPNPARTVTVITVLFALVAFPGCIRQRHVVYLTWQGDTSTTMTVNYHTSRPPEGSTVYYDLASRDGRLNEYRFNARGEARQIPGLRDGRYINSVELTGLQPGATYYFVAGDPVNGYSREKKFRTIPEDNTPLRFVSGGDMSALLRAKRLLRQAAEFDPMFAMIGGDLAYDNGHLHNYFLWDIWLGRWGRIMVNSDGTLVPMVLAVGNHEVNELEGTYAERAPFFWNYFPQGEQPYFTRTFGADLALIVLDTGHLVPYTEQTEWLEEQLAAHAHYPYTMALYHVPLYPSHRSFEDGRSVEGRQEWLPHFDAYELTVAFENHDHTFKRTKRLRGGEVHPQGTLYLGDGSMGVRPREPDPTRWYLEKANATPHFWVVDTSPAGIDFRAVDEHGNVFDEYTLVRESVAEPVPALAE